MRSILAGWRNGIVPLLIILCVSCLSTRTQAQTDFPPKVGLALSGGNAKAFAHVGVLKVLEEAGVNVDVVTGTSMGAILGILYATGQTPAQLEEFVTQQNWELLLSDAGMWSKPTVNGLTAQPALVTLPVRRGLPRLPASIAEGQRFSDLLARITWPVQSIRDFRALPIPFAAVATDLETGAAVRMEGGFLPDVLRASSAIPSVFAPVMIDGRLLGDGGLARNIPAEDARALGADLVVCSDVSDSLEPADSLISFVALLNQTIAFRMSESNGKQRRFCDVLIQPDIDGIPSTAVERAPEWIHRGEVAARAKFPDLERLAFAGRRRPGTLPRADSVYITTVEFEGLSVERHRTIRSVLNLRAPVWVTPAMVADAIERVFATGSFALVRYRLESGPAGSTTLVVILDERSRDAVVFGFRYESRYKGSVFLGATVYNVLQQGSVARIDLRLGEQGRLGGEYMYRFGPRQGLTVGVSGAYRRAPFSFYRQGRRIGNRRIDLFDGTAFGGVDIGRSAVIGFQVTGEHVRGDPTGISPPNLDTERTLHTVSAVARVNTYGRDFFPDRGFALVLKSEWAGSGIGSSASFSQYIVSTRAHAPVGSSVAVFGGLLAGSTSGADIPAHKAFFLGGSNDYYLLPDRHVSFLGLEPQELSGRHVQAVHAGVQYEAFDDAFVQLRWNAGTTLDRWSVSLDRFVNGYGLIAGAQTVIGQVRFTLAGQDLAEWPDVEVDVGYRF